MSFVISLLKIHLFISFSFYNSHRSTKPTKNNLKPNSSVLCDVFFKDCLKNGNCSQEKWCKNCQQFLLKMSHFMWKNCILRKITVLLESKQKSGEKSDFLLNDRDFLVLRRSTFPFSSVGQSIVLILWWLWVWSPYGPSTYELDLGSLWVPSNSDCSVSLWFCEPKLPRSNSLA